MLFVDPFSHKETAYKLINDYSFFSLVEILKPTPIGTEIKWIKIKNKPREFIEISDREMPKWLKITILIRSLIILIPSFLLESAYYLYTLIKHDTYSKFQTHTRQILAESNFFIASASKDSYQTAIQANRAFPVANITISPLASPLPPELWFHIYSLHSKEGFITTRRSLSLVNKELYHNSNSCAIWNLVSKTLGVNLFQNEDCFYHERALFIVSYQQLKSDYQSYHDFFKNDDTLSQLPIYWKPEQWDEPNPLISCLVKTKILGNGIRVFSHKEASDLQDTNWLIQFAKNHSIVRMIDSKTGLSDLIFRCTFKNSDVNSKSMGWVIASLKSKHSFIILEEGKYPTKCHDYRLEIAKKLYNKSIVSLSHSTTLEWC